MGQSRPLLHLYLSFSHFNGNSSFNFNNINWEKCKWCAWDSNPGRRMVAADETTDLWRPPIPIAQTFALNKLVEVINNKLINAKGNLLAPTKDMQLCNVIKTKNNKVRFLKKKEMNNKCFIEDAQSFWSKSGPNISNKNGPNIWHSIVPRKGHCDSFEITIWKHLVQLLLIKRNWNL